MDAPDPQQSSRPSDWIAITGAGIHSALGDVEALFGALSRGESALKLSQLPSVPGFPPIPAAAAKAACINDFLPDRKLLKYMSPTSQASVLAAGRALKQAEILGSPELCRELGLFVATSLIAFDPAEVHKGIQASKNEDGMLDMKRLGREGLRRCHPLMPFKMLLNMPIGLISMIFGIRGENAIFYPGASQAAACLDSTLRHISSGRIKRALLGGVVQHFSLLPLCTLKSRGLLAKSIEAAQPFTPQHNGFAPADAAAFLVLESWQEAIGRGAKPWAMIDAKSLACARFHDSANKKAIALKQVLSPQNIHGSVKRDEDLVLASGSPDWSSDTLQLKVLQDLWVNRTPRLTSLDGRIGYTGAATPFLMAALAAMAFHTKDALPLALLSSPQPSPLYPGEQGSLNPQRMIICVDSAGECVSAFSLFPPGVISCGT